MRSDLKFTNIKGRGVIFINNKVYSIDSFNKEFDDVFIPNNKIVIFDINISYDLGTN